MPVRDLNEVLADLPQSDQDEVERKFQQLRNGCKTCGGSGMISAYEDFDVWKGLNKSFEKPLAFECPDCKGGRDG